MKRKADRTRWPFTLELDCRLRAELARLAPLLAMADDADRERILEHAFLLIGLDPDWADWLPYAREYLPAYCREGDDGDVS